MTYLTDKSCKNMIKKCIATSIKLLTSIPIQSFFVYKHLIIFMFLCLYNKFIIIKE